MKRSIIAVAAALALSPLVARSQPYAYGPYSTPPRNPWYMSLGIGTGTGWSHSLDGTRSFRDILTNDGSGGASDNAHLALNLQVGATLSPNLLLGFDLSVLRGFGSLLDSGYVYDTYVQLLNGDLMLTIYPMARGLFLRAGTGLSVLSTDISAGGPPYDTIQYSGFNFTGGIGYAFQVSPSFNITLNVDYSRQWYPEHPDGLTTSSMVVAFLGFGWY